MNQTSPRFEDMRITAQRLRAELCVLSRYSYGEATTDWVMGFLRQRLSGTPVRAYYVDKVADYIADRGGRRPSGRAWQHLLHTQLPLLYEGVITIQYLHNQILDAKSGVDERARIRHNLLAANLLKDQLYRYIDHELPRFARRPVTAALRRCYELVDLGQRLEQDYNTIERLLNAGNLPLDLPTVHLNNWIELEGAEVFIDKVKRDIPRPYWEFTDLYFQRIYLTCAALFVNATDLLLELMVKKRDRFEPLRRFAVCYGLMRQLVNDNADWLPAAYGLSTNAKTAADAMSDLRNGVATLPLVFYLGDGRKGAIADYLKQPAPLDDEMADRLFADVLQSGALYKSIQNSRILGELAVSYLGTAPAAAYLVDSCEIVHWNKFLAPCLRHEAYTTYRQTPYHGRTRRLIRSLRRQRQSAPGVTSARPGWWPAPRPEPTPHWIETYAGRLLRQETGRMDAAAEAGNLVGFRG